MNKDLEEYTSLLETLKLEKEKDLEEFRRKVEQLPLEKRLQEGVSWYPLQILKSGFTIGERAFVTVERTRHLDEEHQFRAGKTIRLFTRQPAVKRPEVNGVVYYVKKNRMKIILNSKDLPEWLALGLVGADLLFDERTYLEMERALKLLIEAKGNRLAELRAVALGKQPPACFSDEYTIQLPDLNPAQNDAVNRILAARDFTVVHGPPGTGKTTTLVQAVGQLVKYEQTVLVTAPSNTAVDLLTERLAQSGLQVVRIGNISRVEEQVINTTLEMRLAAHPDSKNIKKIKKDAAEARRKAKRYRRNFGPEEYQERNRLFREAGELMSWANQLEERLLDQILDSAQVITCTLVGAADKVLSRRKFRTVVIDEAAQALEPATWIPILKASRVVLTGDPFQLPPTVKSAEAMRRGLNITLIEKCLNRFQSVSLLNIQYRMNAEIMSFSNQQFYDGRLQAADSVRSQRLEITENSPLVFIDTAGCGFEEKVHEAYQSRFNPEEYQILAEHLHQLLKAFEGQELPSIAIISPYREQAQYIEKALEDDPDFSQHPITVNTIDGFQGQEKDIVYISLVRSNAKGEIGFLKDYRRMNVALTRARKQLIVVGDSATIGNSPFYQALLQNFEDAGSYQTAWTYMM